MKAKARKLAINLSLILALIAGSVWATWAHPPNTLAAPIGQPVGVSPDTDPTPPGPEEALRIEICAHTLDPEQIAKCRTAGYQTQEEPDFRAAIDIEEMATGPFAVTTATQADGSVVIVMVIDLSSSMKTVDITEAKAGMHDFLAWLVEAGVDAMVGIGRHGSYGALLLAPTANFVELHDFIDGLPSAGTDSSSDFCGSVSDILDEMDPDPDVLVIWTDAGGAADGGTCTTGVPALGLSGDNLDGTSIGGMLADWANQASDERYRIYLAALGYTNAVFVSPDGRDRGDCRDPGDPCETFQFAADLQPGWVIAGAGNYMGRTHLTCRDEMSQTVRIDHSMGVLGGRAGDWTVAEVPTVLNPNGLGRGLTVSGTVTVTLQDLVVMNGNGFAMPFPGWEVENWWLQHGGALLAIDGPLIRAYNCEFAHGEGRDAGGLAIEHSRLEIDSCHLHDNGDYAIDLYGGSNSSITNTTFEDNEAGVFLFYSSYVPIDSCRFVGQTGNGVRFYGQRGTSIVATEFISNGTSVYGAWADDLTIEDVVMTGRGTGDGIHCAFCDRYRLNRSIVQGWSVGADLAFGDNEEITNSLFTSISGKAIDAAGGVTIQHVNFLHNGHGPHAWSGDSEVFNSIIANNEVGLSTDSESELRGSHNLVWGNVTPSEGNVEITSTTEDNPLVDPLDGIHIDPCSRARDNGIDVGVTTDYDNEDRPEGAGYDIGADEVYGTCLPAPGIAMDLDPDTTHIFLVGDATVPVRTTVTVTNTGNVPLEVTVNHRLQPPTGLTDDPWWPTFHLEAGASDTKVFTTTRDGSHTFTGTGVSPGRTVETSQIFRVVDATCYVFLPATPRGATP